MKVPIESSVRIRALFLALMLWMAIQYLITARYGEPYPALAMPSFAGTLTDRNGNTRIQNVKCKVLFRDGGEAWTSEYDLLSQAPSAYHDAIMRHMFGPVPTDPPRLPRRLTALLFPGRFLSRYREAQQELDSQTRLWLKRRMQALYPSQTVTAVTFVWYADIFNLQQVQPITVHEPLGTREVRFR
jgi:hypothetical protein